MVQGRRGAPLTRRDDREYREYLRKEQRSQRGCIAGRMQTEFHHGLLTRRARRETVIPACSAVSALIVVYTPGRVPGGE
jgi:hypothetical protein